MEFEIPKSKTLSIIKVIGVGGGGSNAVNHMFNQGIKGVDFIICNTDLQALEASSVPIKIQLGQSLTEGRGAGSTPEIGKNAAVENIEEVRSILEDNTKMIFVTAGMGGGTGTGAAPVIAKIAKDLGILTVGIVTVPFSFEGRKRKLQAEEGLEELRKSVDTLLVINNDRLREMYGNLPLSSAFAQADEILSNAAKGIAEVISVTGAINVDFNDVNTVMKDSGVAIMGSAIASGDDRAIKAIKNVISSPLLNDNDISGAQYVLLNITYGEKEILMDEINEITEHIQQEAGSTAEVIWGHGQDDNLGDNICVTMIATGFNVTPITGFEKAPEKKISILEDNKNQITPPFPTKNNTNIETEKTDFFIVKKNENIQENDLAEIHSEKNEVSEKLDLSVSNEKKEEEKVITHFLFEEQVEQIEQNPEEKRTEEEIQNINEIRHQNIYELSQKIKTAEGLAEIENIPAYKRQNIKLDELNHSSECKQSKFDLDFNDNETTIKDNNSFLHRDAD